MQHCTCINGFKYPHVKTPGVQPVTLSKIAEIGVILCVRGYLLRFHRIESYSNKQ